MFDLIDGLPVHPLIVHAVVVLLPLAVLGTLAIALVSSWRARYGALVLACSVVATALIPVATSSGEALAHRVGEPEQHAHLADQLIWFAIPLVVLDAALWWFARSGRPGRVVHVVAALAVIAGLATTVQVYRVGDSGARAAWGGQVSAGQPVSGDGD